jgi:hypothetical protein
MKGSQPVPNAESTWSRAARYALLLGVAALFATAVANTSFNYLTWGDRDLVRGASLLTDFQAAGAELSSGHGGRIPGPATTLVMGLLLALDGDPKTVFREILLLAMLSAAWVYRVIARRLDPWTATAALVLWTTSGTWWASFEQIWNPGLLPVFFAAILASIDRVIGDRDGRAWAPLCVATALAGQLHLSALLFVAMALPALIWARAPGSRRGLTFGLAGAALTYVPYLIEELRNGGHNTWLLTRQDIVSTWAAPSTHQASLGTYVEMLIGDTPPAGVLSHALFPNLLTLTHHGAFVFGVAAGAWALGAVWTRTTPSRTAEVLATFALIIIGSLLWYGADNTLLAVARYMLLIVPLLAILSGAGLTTLTRHAWRRSPVTGALVTALVGLLLATPLVDALIQRSRLSTTSGYERLQITLSEVREHTGWSLTELAGRTLWLITADTPSGLGWRFHPSIHHQLLREGARFQGSKRGTCAMLLHKDQAGDELDLTWVNAVLAQNPPANKVLAVHELSGDTRLVLYTRSGGHCPASMTTRYLLTPAEQQLSGLLRTLPCDGPSTEVPADVPATRRVAASLSGRADGSMCGAFGLSVDLSWRGIATHVTLHSNQLRGESSNAGPLATKLLLAPTLRWVHAETGAVVEQVLDEGFVGHKGAVTPLHAEPLHLSRGVWSVTLRTQQLEVRGKRWPISSPTLFDVEIPLLSDWTVR